MNYFNKIFCCALIVFSLPACIDELNVETPDAQRLLVVEGFIDTNPGPHRIKLSRSAKYGSILDDAIQNETNATVWVRDEEGDQVFLSESTDGLYETPTNFSAEVGKKYTLNITLNSGERYISTSEEVQAVPPIDEAIIVTDAPFRLGAEAYARWQDPAGIDNFYLLEADGIYVLNSRPELFVARNPFGNPVPMPKDCCDRCYVSEFSVDTEIHLLKDNNSDGNVQTELAGFVPDDGRRFMERYMVAIKLSSLTKEAFQFLELIKEQLSIEGNIFDPPPAKIRGNMINLDNPDEDVIGYFRASAVSSDTIFVTGEELPDPLPIDQLNDDCRVIEFASTVKPPFWP
ncbi:MAG: DUF4249 domain-containing protein [Bacteroidota bacterium]